jgi:glyoxylase-like metal-dependent hydrolase (beta-lactamase superfamily II)
VSTELLARHDVARVRADNPGPFTLDGTNTWVLGRDPAWIVDPGPLVGGHVEAVAAEVAARGGAGGIALTHSHRDHTEAVDALLEVVGSAPVAAAAAGRDVRLGDGDSFGPFTAIPTAGHAPDHLALVAGAVGFTGDAVLGTGSVFVAPGPGSLDGYLDALRRLRALPLELLCPGHGPPIGDPAAKLDEYLAHRLDRERRLIDALARGLRGEDELLDDVWDDAPKELRLAAHVTLRAHLDKLREEGRLPGDLEIAALDLGDLEV